MRIAVATDGEGSDRPVDERFGRCAMFAVYDVETRETRFIENEGKDASSGAGVKAAQQLIDLGVDVLVTGKVGPSAQEILDEAGIRVEAWTKGTVGEAIELFGKTADRQ